MRLLAALTRRPWRGLAVVALASLAVVWTSDTLRSAVRDRMEPGRGASWIWARGAASSEEPVAFLAVRDVDLDRAPGTGWIEVTADESYLLFVNGRRIGSGVYRDGAPIDRYDVADVLRPGHNRIVVEARSARGAGGLLATLRLEHPDEVVLGTDETWTIVRRAAPSVQAPSIEGHSVQAGPSRPDGESPRVWGRPPVGRWRVKPATDERPRWRPTDERPAVRARDARVDGTTWFDLSRRWRRFPVRRPVVLLDWGEEVTGYLTLELARHDGAAALALFGGEGAPPDIRGGADVVVQTLEGTGRWTDASLRTFRYLALVGAVPASTPLVHIPPEGDVEQLDTASPAVEGILWLEPPEVPNPPEVVEVWLRLEREMEAFRRP